jgi:hypothetical protein
MSKIQEKPSALKREHPAALQNMKFLTFFYVYASFFALLDPDSEWIRIHKPV